MQITDDMVAAGLTAYLKTGDGSYEGPWPLQTAMSNTLIEEHEVGMRAALLAVAPLIEASAIAAERERCAKVAEGWEVEIDGTTYMTCGNGNFWDPDTQQAQGRIFAAGDIRCAHVAVAIRSLKKP